MKRTRTKATKVLGTKGATVLMTSAGKRSQKQAMKPASQRKAKFMRDYDKPKKVTLAEVNEALSYLLEV